MAKPDVVQSLGVLETLKAIASSIEIADEALTATKLIRTLGITDTMLKAAASYGLTN